MDNQAHTPNPIKKKHTGRWKLFAILAVCASPLIGSYLAYYVVKPGGRTNYGEILDPRSYPLPSTGTTARDGKPLPIAGNGCCCRSMAAPVLRLAATSYLPCVSSGSCRARKWKGWKGYG